MAEPWRGMRMLLRGFGWWRRDPGVMARALLPGLLVAIVFAAALVALLFGVGPLTEAITPFAAGWPEGWRLAVRVAIATALIAGTGFLAVVSFTAVTLAVGEPFYDRVWRSVERGTTGAVPDTDYGFGAAVADSARLIVKGIGVAILAGLLGLIPAVGVLIGTAVGFLLTATLVADELSSRALTARGLDRSARRRLLRSRRWRVLGFGMATQLCFLVPLGAVIVMPAAVAGSTLLVQSLLEASVPPPAPRPVSRTRS